VNLDRLRGRIVLGVVAVVLNAVVGCGNPWHVQQRSDPDPELVALVAEVGEWVLPPDATAVAASALDSLDDTYALTLVMQPASVDVLLRESRFTAPLQQGDVEFSRGADGSPLVPGPAMWCAHQKVPRPPGKDPTDLRLVVVDRTDPRRVVVHLEVWT
jgi:hypothetical protein